MSAAITGPASSTYAPTYEAYKVYFKRVNDAGGINGQKVEITYEDDRGEPQRAAANAKKLGETLDPHGQRVDLRDVQAVHDRVGDGEDPAPVRRRRLPARSVPARAPADLLLDLVRLEVGQPLRARRSSRSRRRGKKVKVGFAAQDIPLSRIELEFAEQLAKEMGIERDPGRGRAGQHAGLHAVRPEAEGRRRRLGAVVGAVARRGRRLRGAPAYRLEGELSPVRAPADAGRAGAAEGGRTSTRSAATRSSWRTCRSTRRSPTSSRVRRPIRPHYMAEGWVSAMVLEAALKKCGWPCPKDKLATAMAAVSVDTKGLRGGPIEWTRGQSLPEERRSTRSTGGTRPRTASRRSAAGRASRSSDAVTQVLATTVVVASLYALLGGGLRARLPRDPRPEPGAGRHDDPRRLLPVPARPPPRRASPRCRWRRRPCSPRWRAS